MTRCRCSGSSSASPSAGPARRRGAREPDPQAGKESVLLRLDSAKARDRLGWTPAWDLAAGLDATVQWYAGGDPRGACEAQLEAYGAG